MNCVAICHPHLDDIDNSYTFKNSFHDSSNLLTKADLAIGDSDLWLCFEDLEIS